MPPKTLQEVLTEARSAKRAVGHFNIADSTTLRAICEAAVAAGQPVVIGTSEGEREFLGVHEAAALVRAAREHYGIPVFLNADHTHSFDHIKEAVKAGYDAVLFDGAKLPFEENVRQTKEVVDWVRVTRPEVVVEGELGYIGSSSEVFTKAPEGAAMKPEDLTTAEQVASFVAATGVDLIAPAVGNLHGMFAGAPNPSLDIPRIGAIVAASPAQMVLHGGSGIPDTDFRAAIAAGVPLIHINTELRLAWKNGFTKSLTAMPDQVVPYKLLTGSLQGVREVVKARMRLFAGLAA